MDTFASGNGSSGGGRGEISGVKVSGDTAVVTFAKVKSQQQKLREGPRGQPRPPDRFGRQPHLRVHLRDVGDQTINEPPFKEQTIKAKYATGLKKGSFVYIVEDVVSFAYAKAGASAPIAVSGVAVK